MAWIRICVVLVARTVLCVIVGLVLASFAPRLLGWQSSVVLTGSMEPTMRTGDVVSYQPMPALRVKPGQVMLFHDPAQPGHLLAHRYVSRDAKGLMITRGDANGHDDSTPVTDSAVIGIARMAVPKVGLPMVWWHQGQRGRTAAAVVAMLAISALAGVKMRKPTPAAAQDATPSDSPDAPKAAEEAADVPQQRPPEDAAQPKHAG